MLDEKKIAELDQGTKLIAEVVPPIWWGLYKGLTEQGFSESQAMDLLKVYVAGWARGTVG